MSSASYTSAHAAAPGTSKRKGRKRAVVLISIAVTAVLGGTAWAAIALFGFGTLDASAATTQNLTVDPASIQLTKKLVPGQTVGAKAVVTNPNDFPVVVTNVIVRNATVAVTPNTTDCRNTVHLIGTATTWPGDGGGAGTLQTLSEDVSIPAGQSRWVQVDNAVKQDASATTLCGIHADFAVKAQTATS